MSATATLTYHATAVGPTVPANLKIAMQNTPIDETQIETVTGATLTSDVTTLVGAMATRTIVFGINNPAFQANFPPLDPNVDPASPFRGLYLQLLSASLNTKVVEDPVAIA